MPPGWWSAIRAARMTGCSPATTTAQPLAWDQRAAARSDADAADARAGDRGELHAAGRPPRAAGLPADGRALSRRRIRAGCGAPSAAASPPRRIRRIAAELAACRLRADDRARPALDRFWRPPAREDDRPPGRHACHARHLGPFQRLPYLPRASICCRCCSAPSIRPAACATSRPSRGRSRRARKPAGKGAQAEHAAAGHAARLPARAGGPAGRRRRHAAAHRQGLFLGGAAGRRTA